jgi:hypothetical protein
MNRALKNGRTFNSFEQKIHVNHAILYTIKNVFQMSLPSLISNMLIVPDIILSEIRKFLTTKVAYSGFKQY